jgi:hypothetical protein
VEGSSDCDDVIARLSSPAAKIRKVASNVSGAEYVGELIEIVSTVRIARLTEALGSDTDPPQRSLDGLGEMVDLIASEVQERSFGDVGSNNKDGIGYR